MNSVFRFFCRRCNQEQPATRARSTGAGTVESIYRCAVCREVVSTTKEPYEVVRLREGYRSWQ